MTAANALPPADRSIEIYQPDAQVGELKLWRAPEEVLMEAQQAAAALQRRIAGKKKPVVFNGEQYIENDDWQMVANFFGYSPKIISTEFVEYGDVQGFKAIAELIHEHTGRVVGRGEALCLDEEDNWGERTKYEWQDALDIQGKKIWENGKCRRVKVAVGSVATPLFQLASMAQTRACNKAMSNKLKWVVSLAGYSTTPAEDMHDATMAPKAEPVADDLPTEIRRKPAQTTSAAQQSTPVKRSSPAVVGAEAGVTPGASASTLPAQVWCVCGHISGQHGAASPHRCACDGNQWINGQGSICNCQGFQARPTSSPTYQNPRQVGRANGPIPTSAPQAQRAQVITEAQSRRFYALWKSAGKDKEEVQQYLREEHGISSDRDMTVARYQEACAWAERQSGGRW